MRSSVLCSSHFVIYKGVNKRAAERERSVICGNEFIRLYRESERRDLRHFQTGTVPLFGTTKDTGKKTPGNERYRYCNRFGSPALKSEQSCPVVSPYCTYKEDLRGAVLDVIEDSLVCR